MLEVIRPMDILGDLCRVLADIAIISSIQQFLCADCYDNETADGLGAAADLILQWQSLGRNMIM